MLLNFSLHFHPFCIKGPLVKFNYITITFCLTLHIWSTPCHTLHIKTYQNFRVWPCYLPECHRCRGGRHKSCLSCSPNPAYAMPLPFWSNPLFLSKTRVHVSPLSKYDAPELKSEFAWWLSRGAWSPVIGPSGVGLVDASVGVDVSLVVMSSSRVASTRPASLHPCENDRVMVASRPWNWACSCGTWTWSSCHKHRTAGPTSQPLAILRLDTDVCDPFDLSFPVFHSNSHLK
jgi:hypothetical protein